MKVQNYKKMSKVFLDSVKHAPQTKQGDLLIEGKNKRLKKITPLDVKHQGSTFKLILDLFEQEKNKYKELKSYVGHGNSLLIALLKEKGYITPNVELHALIADVELLNIIVPTKEYDGFEIVNGYIVGKGYDAIFVKRELPEDIYKGYYKSDNRGKFELDKELYELMWRTV